MSSALTGRLRLQLTTVSLKTIIDEAPVAGAHRGCGEDDAAREDRLGRPVSAATRTGCGRWCGNLLANAIKFTPQRGGIFVTLETNDIACITVRDTGPGVATDFLPRVFDRFTQADSSPTRGAGGLGVGLSLVRELVERHGGEIKVANDPCGGAVVTVRLPLRHDEERVTPPAANPPRTVLESPPLDGIRVLLLDRDHEARELLGAVLRQRGASVQIVASVDDALELLESWRPDARQRHRVARA